MTEKKVLKGMFGPERELREGWRKLHDKELHNFHSSPNDSSDQMKEEMGATCRTHVEDEKCVHTFSLTP
jgi:hypothetical protein